MTVELFDHQQKALGKMHNGCVLWAGVGTGKSITAAAYYMKVEADADVFVITTAKKRDSMDWEKEFAKFGIGKKLEGTTAGRLTVDSWNNIGKYEDVKNSFFIFDEQRVVGSGEWAQKFIEIAKANRWIVLTATPGDTWLDYVPIFIANGFYRNRSEFKRQHVVYNAYAKFPKVDRYTDVGRLVRLRNQILVEMPYVRRTVRTPRWVDVEFDCEQVDRVTKQRWNVFKEKPLRDIAEMFIVTRRVVNSHPSRVQAVKKLLEEHERLIVFYNFDYELAILRTLANEEYSWQSEQTRTRANTTSSASGSLATSAMSRRGASAVKAGSPESRFTPRTTSSTLSSGPTRTNHDEGSPAPKTSLDTWLTGKSIAPKTSPSSLDRSKNAHLESNSNPSLAASRMTNGSGSKNSASGIQSLAVAEWNGHKHQEIPETDRWLYLVQYTAGAEGWNCVETNATCFYSLTYSYKIWEQAHGRIDRINTPFSVLYYYILMSSAWIDTAIWRSLSQKKNFNESEFRNETDISGS